MSGSFTLRLLHSSGMSPVRVSVGLDGNRSPAVQCVDSLYFFDWACFCSVPRRKVSSSGQMWVQNRYYWFMFGFFCQFGTKWTCRRSEQLICYSDLFVLVLLIKLWSTPVCNFLELLFVDLHRIFLLFKYSASCSWLHFWTMRFWGKIIKLNLPGEP